MIKIFRQDNMSIYMRFDDEGNEKLIKMFSDILEGKEVILDVEFDMSVVKMKKALQKSCTIIVKNDNEIDGATLYLKNEKIIWKIDSEYSDMGVDKFKNCKEKGFFYPAEFMYIQVSKNKKLDCMYCELVTDM